MALDGGRSKDYALPADLDDLRGPADETAETSVPGSTARAFAQSALSGVQAARRFLAAGVRRTRAPLRLARRKAARAVPVTLSALAPVGRWFSRLPVVRFVSASLRRRILVSNLLGFVILVGGILYLGFFHTWLIDAKLDALKTQGKIIADAIASNATVVRERIILDPNRLPSTPGSVKDFPEDGFDALELSIRPEDVTPIIRKLIQPTNTRARIYARDGTLIVDTARSLAHWTAMGDEPQTNGNEQPNTQNIWSRLTRYFFKEPLPVYQEIGTANGMAYREVKDALDGKERSMLLLNTKGEQIVSIALPIRRFDDIQGVLLLSTRPGQIDKILNEERRVILILATIALLASIVTSLTLARMVAGPMRRLSDAAEQASHNIAARAQLPEFDGRTDEVGQMAEAFKAMTTALYRRIEASEKFAADVAHELKNPLTAARSTAESLGFAKTDEERDHLVQQIQGELKRLNRLITDVSNASRLDAELARKEMRPVDVTVMLRNLVTIFRDIIGDESRFIALKVEREPFEGAFIITGDEGRLGQVLTNLLDNALSFSPEGATVTVRARANRDNVEISVEDQGPGIPADRLQIIFDRFYSDRPATDQSRGKNSGLGLSISREIVLAHGGEIIAENRYETGTREGGKPAGARFIVRLPLTAQTQRGSTQRGGAQGGRRT